MKKKLMTLLMAGLLAVSVCVPVFAESDVEQDSAGNVFASGDTVSLPGGPIFTAFAAGQNVDLADSESEGSIFAAGQQLTASGASIGESMYVAGNNVTLNNVNVQGNIFAAGNVISVIGESAANGVYMCGQNLTFEGETNKLVAAGSHVTVKGTIQGDVDISADSIEIADGTKILGELKVTSSTEPSIPSGAEIGKYTYDKASEAGESAAEIAASVSIGSIILNKIKSCFFWIIAMAAFGMILCWLFDEHLVRAKDYIKNRTGAMVVTGIVGYICIPIAILLLCCTCIFAPIAGILALTYVLLCCVGLAFAGASLVRLVLPNMNVFLSALIGIAVLEALRMVPVLGTVIAIAADMYLIGYVLQIIWLHRMQKKNAE